MLVALDDDVTEVERVRELAFRDNDRGVRAQRVANAEFICGVHVVGREVGNDQVCPEDLLEHRLVDRARVPDLVSAHAFEAGLGHRFLDDFIRCIEIQRATRGIVLLLVESLDDEARFHGQCVSLSTKSGLP